MLKDEDGEHDFCTYEARRWLRRPHIVAPRTPLSSSRSGRTCSRGPRSQRTRRYQWCRTRSIAHGSPRYERVNNTRPRLLTRDIPNTPAGHGGHFSGDDEHDEVADAEHLHVDRVRGPWVWLLCVALGEEWSDLTVCERPYSYVNPTYGVQKDGFRVMARDLLWWGTRSDCALDELPEWIASRVRVIHRPLTQVCDMRRTVK